MIVEKLQGNRKVDKKVEVDWSEKSREEFWDEMKKIDKEIEELRPAEEVQNDIREMKRVLGDFHRLKEQLDKIDEVPYSELIPSNLKRRKSSDNLGDEDEGTKKQKPGEMETIPGSLETC